MTKKTIGIVKWVLIAIIILIAIVEFSTGGIISGFFILLSAIAISPLIKKLNTNLNLDDRQRRMLQIVSCVILFFIGIITSPSSSDSENKTEQQIATTETTTTTPLETTSTTSSLATTTTIITTTKATTVTTVPTTTTITTTTFTTTILTTKELITEPITIKEPEPEPEIDYNDSVTVYVTPTGKKYHYSDSCNGGTYRPSTLSEALRRGLKPCNKCVG